VFGRARKIPASGVIVHLAVYRHIADDLAAGWVALKVKGARPFSGKPDGWGSWLALGGEVLAGAGRPKSGAEPARRLKVPQV